MKRAVYALLATAALLAAAVLAAGYRDAREARQRRVILREHGWAA